MGCRSYCHLLFRWRQTNPRTANSMRVSTCCAIRSSIEGRIEWKMQTPTQKMLQKKNLISKVFWEEKKKKKRNEMIQKLDRGVAILSPSLTLYCMRPCLSICMCVCAHKHPARKCVSSFLPVSIFVCCIPSSPPPLIPLSPFLTNTRRQKKGGKKNNIAIDAMALIASLNCAV